MRSPWPLVRRSFDRVTIYLPIIVTAALALGTYWLVRNAPAILGPAAKEAPVHEADYFMRDFSIKNFLPNGRLRSEVFGTEGRHYPDTDTLEVDHVRWRSVSDDGLVTRGSALRGLSNGDGTEVQLFGDAVVVREPGVSATGVALPRLEFRGEFLHAFTDTQRVKSDQPVTVLRGQDKFTADSMDYDSLSGVANLHGRVRGMLMPPPAQLAAPSKPSPKAPSAKPR